FLGQLRRHEPYLLPDALLGNARHATPGLHLRLRPRVGQLQPDVEYRRVYAVRRDADFPVQLLQQPLAWTDRRPQPVARWHARVEHSIAAARIQFRSSTAGDVALSALGRK